jgi:hypothetical protein
LSHEIGKGLEQIGNFLSRFGGKGRLGLQFFVGLLEHVNVIYTKELLIRHEVPKGLHKAVHTAVCGSRAEIGKGGHHKVLHRLLFVRSACRLLADDEKAVTHVRHGCGVYRQARQASGFVVR